MPTYLPADKISAIRNTSGKASVEMEWGDRWHLDQNFKDALAAYCEAVDSGNKLVEFDAA